jgi:virginiamycin B lyase
MLINKVRTIVLIIFSIFLAASCSQEQGSETQVNNTPPSVQSDLPILDAGSANNMVPAVSLAGQVFSLEEGLMEGVLVTVRRDGATYTVTVVSDDQGRYSFPLDRLEPGQYTMSIRAVGYDLVDPGKVTVSGNNTAEKDLELVPTADLASQLSNGEWLLSMTGSVEQKQQFLGCIVCHTLERPMRSKHNSEEFARVINRMSIWAQGSTPMRPQMRPDSIGRNAMAEDPPARAKKFGEFASTVNLSHGDTWGYELKTLPRPSGKGTKVIITEYDLPRAEALPHDAIVDEESMVWYGDFGSQFLGKLDPADGSTEEFPVPITKPEAPGGNLDMNFDPDGNIFLGQMYQGVIMKFNPDTKEFESWKSPLFDAGDDARTAMVTPTRVNVDGKVWTGGVEEYQVDLNTGEWIAIDYTKGIPEDRIEEASRIGSYGVAVDSMNNFYGMELGGDHVTRVDAKTMNVKPFRTPTPNAGPRRGHMDDQDRLWFAEFRGNRIGMFDTRTEEFKEYEMTLPWTNPYDAILDDTGHAWAGGMSNDYVGRVNINTGETTMYLLPGTTNIRRVDVDNNTSPPSFWIGDNLEGTLIRVEPLE